MHDIVRTQVDELFDNRPHTREMEELREEVLADLEERFEDDVRGGLTQAQATDRLRDSLREIRRMLDGGKAPEPPTPHRESSEIKMRFAAQGAVSVDVRMLTLSIVVERVSGEDFLIGYEGNQSDFNTVHSEMRGSTLTIEERKGDLFEGLGKLFRMRTTSKLHVGVPQSLRLDYNLKATSGDILVNAPVRAATLEAFSSRVSMEAPVGSVADRIAVSCKSGTVDLRLDARSVKVEVFSGRVEAEGWFSDAMLHTTSGNVHMHGHAVSLNASTTSGNVRAEGTFGRTMLSTVSGNVRLACESAPEAVEANAVSGGVRIALPANIPGFSLRATAVSGRVKNDFGTDQWGQGGSSLSLRTTSGSIHIEKA